MRVIDGLRRLIIDGRLLMENLAHTLAGISLAKAGLDRATPLATTALVISSNIPDIDAVTWLFGGTATYLENHRGLTHSFAGLLALALILAFALIWFDRRFRLRHDPFLRPAKPVRLFLMSYLGGLGHLFMDYTNSDGARPLLPFEGRWFYGDLAFVVDPWIWLILGATAVWLTTRNSGRAVLWIVPGVLTSLLMYYGGRQMTVQFPPIPQTVRIVWFVGLAIIILGAFLKWGRAGARFARYSLFALAIYYSGLWLAHQEAMDRARATLPDDRAQVAAVWPTPANPFLWRAVATGDGVIHSRFVDILGSNAEWREEPSLDAKFVEPLRVSPKARAFLWFSRLAVARVEETEEGYSIVLRDARFELRMSASLNREMEIRSVDVRWY